MFAITPENLEKEVLARGFTRKEIECPEAIFFTFNKSIFKQLRKRCSLKEWKWPVARFSQYSSGYAEFWKGTFNDKEAGVVIPPMGASTVAALSEELIHFGTRIIFLLCASWSLGKNWLKGGEIHLPNFAAGLDGTTPHYGNNNNRIEAESMTLDILKNLLENENINWKMGGCGTCEAFYRISSNLMNFFREEGCLSVENGETSAIFSIAKKFNINAGVLLQPYINLEKGTSISCSKEEYDRTCKVQADVALSCMHKLLS